MQGKGLNVMSVIVTLRFKKTGVVVRKSIEGSALPRLLARIRHRIDHHEVQGTVTTPEPKRTLPMIQRQAPTMEET